MTAQEFYDSLFQESIVSAKRDRVSTNLQRKVLEAKLRMTVYVLGIIKTSHVQEETRRLLLCGEGANEYYDLINTLMEFVDIADNSFCLFTGLINSLNRFCSKVTEPVYCKVMREFSLKHLDREGSLFSWVSILHLLVIEWYDRGMQSFGWESCRVSLSSIVDVTLLELFVLIMEEFPEIRKNSPVRDKDVKAVKSLLTVLNEETTWKVCLAFLRFLDQHNLLTNFVYTCSYAAFLNLYSKHPQPNVCVQFASIKWNDVDKERVEFARGSLVLILEETGMDLLTYRRVLLNSEGVILKFRESFGLITNVHLYEVHQDDLHYIYVRYKIQQGMQRELVLNIENLETSFYEFLYEMDYNVTVGVLCWFGLQTLLLHGIDSLGEKYQPVKEGLKQWIQDIAACFEEENIIYVTPTWWNYEQKKSEKKGQVIEFTKLVQIATHSRRLPKGQQPSEEAKALAKKYCMILKPGYTLVRGFERKQKVRKQ